MKTTPTHPAGAPLSRRSFVRTGLTALAAPALLGCGTEPEGPVRDSSRLAARPGPPGTSTTIGESPLGFGGVRDGLLYVPEGYDPEVRHPLFVALHGASGEAGNWRGFYGAADARGMVLLVPESRSTTWDRIRGPFGPDIAFLDDALAHTFARCNVDPARVCLGGFSDGASYALSVAVSNGDLFTRMVAFSPGFMAPAEPLVGKPGAFVSHGTADRVLPVRLSRENIVPWLEREGYTVTYREFEGGHTVPAPVATEALDWFVG